MDKNWIPRIFPGNRKYSLEKLLKLFVSIRYQNYNNSFNKKYSIFLLILIQKFVNFFFKLTSLIKTLSNKPKKHY